MTHTTLAILVFGILCAFVIFMFWIERRSVAKRKLNGTYVDISDILFQGAKAAQKNDQSKEDKAVR